LPERIIHLTLGTREDGMTQGKRLESWKEIEAYLKRDFRTLRRWEKEEGLPIHRHTHKSRSSVYAYPSEIDTWRVSRKAEPEPAPVRVFWRWPAFALTMLLCLVMVGNGVRPVSAQQTPQTTRQVWTGEGLNGDGSPSPDGRYLSYSSGRDLGIRDLTTGTSRLLTHHSESSGVGGSLISPDGRQVAYTYWTDYATKFELLILPLTGVGATSPKVVHSAEETLNIAAVGWTPDSKQLLVMRTLRDRTSQMAMISLPDGSLRVLKSFGWQSTGQVRLSPDGRDITYDAPASESEPAHDIFVLAVDGSRERRVVESPAIDWSPFWSPDGSKILFLSDRTGSPSLWTVPIDHGRPTGPVQLIKPDVGFINPLGMTSNGTLYYLSENWGRRNVYVADLDASMVAVKAPVLVSEHFVNAQAAPAWSPDGRYLAYYALLAPNRQMTGITRLIIRTLKTGAEREIRMPRLRVPPNGLASPPKWFPDGRSVLVASYEQQRPFIGFYRVDVADGKAELLHHTKSPVGPGVGQFDLSPDGKSIFYIDMEDPFILQLMRFDLDRQRESELTRGSVFTSLAISPDGTEVVYGKRDSGFKSTVFEVTPVAGGAARQLHRVPMDIDYATLAWSPDQRYLIFAQPDGRELSPQSLWKVPVAGGQPEKMGVSASQIFAAQMRPDGRQIAFTSRENTVQAIWALENFLPKANGK
jgi:Tol biopolymer transport system component